MSATLRDQLGIMGVIDTLRHQDQRLSDYLNAKQQQHEIKQKIIAYYQEQGVAVSDEVVQQGITQWYRDRLRIEPTPLTWFWRAFVSRQRWGALAISLIVGTCLALILTYTFSHAYEEWRQNKITAELSQLQLSHDLLEKQITALNLSASLPGDPPLLQQRSRELYTQQQELLAQLALVSLPQKTRDASEPLVDYSLVTLSAELDTLSTATRALTRSANALLALRDNYSKWQTLPAEHRGVFEKFPQLTELHARVGTWYKQTEGSLTTLQRDEKRLYSALDVALSAEGNMIALSALQSSLEGAGLSPAELAPLMEIVALQRSRYEQLLPADDKAIGYLRYASTTASKTLTLKVNPQNGPRSAVERTYEDGSKLDQQINTGRVSYYAIAQALDVAGNPVPLYITDRETGKTEMATTFGIRISADKYESLRRDKMDDGIINQNTLGAKAKGTLNITPAQGVFNEFITRW